MEDVGITSIDHVQNIKLCTLHEDCPVLIAEARKMCYVFPNTRWAFDRVLSCIKSCDAVIDTM